MFGVLGFGGYLSDGARQPFQTLSHLHILAAIPLAAGETLVCLRLTKLEGDGQICDPSLGSLNRRGHNNTMDRKGTDALTT